MVEVLLVVDQADALQLNFGTVVDQVQPVLEQEGMEYHQRFPDVETVMTAHLRIQFRKGVCQSFCVSVGK